MCMFKQAGQYNYYSPLEYWYVIFLYKVISLNPISYKLTRKCMTLWGEPDRVHMQNMEKLHA